MVAFDKTQSAALTMNLEQQLARIRELKIHRTKCIQAICNMQRRNNRTAPAWIQAQRAKMRLWEEELQKLELELIPLETLSIQ